MRSIHAPFVSDGRPGRRSGPLDPVRGCLANSIVFEAVAPFIANLNDNNAFPPYYSTTPSPANDIAILNFALMLEMLEAEFYFYNVPAISP